MRSEKAYTAWAKSHKCQCGLIVDVCGTNILNGIPCKAGPPMTITIK